MLPLFLNPWALLGLLAVPGLVAIYLLRNRHQRREVSSLLLWFQTPETRSGGPRIEKLRLPLLFFLELLALLLFVLAAAQPYLRTTSNTRPIWVILDDSFSMSAGTETDSPKSRARKALEELLRDRPGVEAHFILAGSEPKFLGEIARSVEDLDEILSQWKCRAPFAANEAAIELATQKGGAPSLILVMTDGAPPTPYEEGRIQWWAFGGERPNVAFTTASRTRTDGSDRCYLEVSNLSPNQETTQLRISAQGIEKPLKTEELNLAQGESYRLQFELPAGVSDIEAMISGDALLIDNTVSLLPVEHLPVRVEIRMKDGLSRQIVEKVLRADPDVILGPMRPEILFTDKGSDIDVPSRAWVVDFMAEKESEAFLGPFIVNLGHPLTEGLNLQGVIWSARGTKDVPGEPVILAGNVPLVTTESRDLTGRTIRLRLRPDLSTLQSSPNWPILLANLIDWRACARPGLSRHNARLGEQVTLTFADVPETVEIKSPEGEIETVHPVGGRLELTVEETGVYELRYRDRTERIAVNALQREESDLGDRASGRWGDWLDQTTLRLEYRRMDWLLVLLGLLVITLHLYISWRTRHRQ